MKHPARNPQETRKDEVTGMAKASQHEVCLYGWIEEARKLLEAEGCYYTDGAKLALLDMLRLAEKALAGEGEIPFIRNREFYYPREEEAVLFAAERFTMVPPFREKGKVYSTYGLEQALIWFRQQDVRAGGMAKLREKGALALDKAGELLGTARLGKKPGCFSETAIAKLKKTRSELAQVLEGERSGKTGTEDILAAAVVSCFNALRELRHSRVLRTDVDPEASLYLTPEGLEKVKATIASDRLIGEQYDKIARIAAHYSEDEIRRAASLIMNGKNNYEELNRHFYLWSSTDKIVNFKALEGAASVRISFVLPSEENEKDGLGHVWIDNLEILSASGGSLPIPNGGFDEGGDEPAYWRPEARKGSPVLKWEDEYPFCGGGDRRQLETANPSSQVNAQYKEGVAKHSLSICNPTGGDEGAWTCTQAVPVTGGGAYTLTFQAKLDGKLKTGVKAILTFLDEAGQTVGSFEYAFNRKSSIPGGRFLLPMQCDAIQYAMTGEQGYARKVKDQLLFMFNDFCQGAEHWLVTNLRPEGNDSYGAVQGGRLLCAAAVSYSLIRGAEVFSPDEKDRFYRMTEYLLRYMLDLRDRTEWTAFEAQEGCSNWQTDMCAGTGFMMMALPDFPNRHTWLNNANFILKAQLELNVNPDSSWPESIRYHHASLERFAGYAKAADNILGENWFADTPLLRMFGYSASVQTPGYGYFDGRIGTPPFGDHALSGGAEFGFFATYLADAAKVDSQLADLIYHTWSAAGKPFKRLWGESVALENILGQGDTYRPVGPLALGSTVAFPDAGIYVFRKGFGSGRESYFAIMSSPRHVGHGHLDQGSFILYKNSVPLVMDSGIEGYFDSSTQWHISSYSHACLQFATGKTDIPKQAGGSINLTAGTYSLERGWADVPRESRVLEIRTGGETESITIEIANPEGQGRHIRHVTWLKEPDLYIIRDTLKDFSGRVLFSLPVAAQRSVIDGNRVYSEGVYDVDLETVFLSPVESLRLEQGRSTPFFGSREDRVSIMDYIRAVADAEAGFLTVLYPKEKEGARLQAGVTPEGIITLRTDGFLAQIDAAAHPYGVALLQLEHKERTSR